MIGWHTIFGPRPERRLARTVAAIARDKNHPAAKVIEGPALYSRAIRRSVGLWGSVWKWDLNASGETRRTYVPRYIRRHYDPVVMLRPSTRRQRRARAGILRAARRTGLGGIR